jgi:hypothetical protein
VYTPAYNYTNKLYIPADKHNDADLETARKGAKACTCDPRFETETRNSRRNHEAEE